MQTKYRPIKFPKDEQAHKHMIEWWYFNGNLKDKKGNKYAFMNTLFKVNVRRTEIPLISRWWFFKTYYFAHSIISDIGKNKSKPAVKNVVIVSKDSFSRPLLFIDYTEPIFLENFSNSIIEETEPFHYLLKTEELDLKMKSMKKPLLEGGKGFTDVLGHKSFYYSLTNMKTSGTIKLNGKPVEVEGKTWMDHQWTNSTGYYEDKWNWFAIQLDNNTEIMCNEYISGQKRDYLVNIVYPDGSQESLEELNLKPGAIWKSRKTKDSYPLVWKIEIPQRDIKLTVEAAVKDQEVVAGLARYWEGPIEIEGTVGDKKVKGAGFMELVNNASPYGKYGKYFINHSRG